MPRGQCRGVAAAFLVSLAAAVHAGPSDQLKELRGRIDELQKQLEESEETKSEATDALRESERAISDANRRLFELARQQREVRAALSQLETQKSRALEGTKSQQVLMAKLLYQQYLWVSRSRSGSYSTAKIPTRSHAI
jgi:septal ring factor EnvC (AmiA/AmiB activator)